GPVTVARLRDAGLRTIVDCARVRLSGIQGIGPSRQTDLEDAIQKVRREAESRFDAGACLEAVAYAEELQRLKTQRVRRQREAERSIRDAELALESLAERIELARRITFLAYLSSRDLTESIKGILKRPQTSPGAQFRAAEVPVGKLEPMPRSGARANPDHSKREPQPAPQRANPASPTSGAPASADGSAGTSATTRPAAGIPAEPKLPAWIAPQFHSEAPGSGGPADDEQHQSIPDALDEPSPIQPHHAEQHAKPMERLPTAAWVGSGQAGHRRPAWVASQFWVTEDTSAVPSPSSELESSYPPGAEPRSPLESSIPTVDVNSIDRGSAPPPEPMMGETLVQLFAVTAFGLAVAKADGRIAASERQEICAFVERKYGRDVVLGGLDSLLSRFEGELPPLDQVLAKVTAVVPACEWHGLYEFAVAVADAAGKRNSREVQCLARIAAALNLNTASPATSTPGSPPLVVVPASDDVLSDDKCRETLEIAEGVPLSAELIRRQFRLLADRYDATRFIEHGPEFAQMAARKRENVERAARTLIAAYNEPLELPAAGPPTDLRYNPDLDAVFGA